MTKHTGAIFVEGNTGPERADLDVQKLLGNPARPTTLQRQAVRVALICAALVPAFALLFVYERGQR
jgi:hypothetical protein